MEFFRRLDRSWATGEKYVTVLVLLSMVFVAGFSAGIRNLTRFDIGWANELLNDMEWADSFLRKATMWLAFLGASQATYYRKHIAIDVLTRLAPVKQRYMMHAAAGIMAAFITFALAFSLSSAVKINLSERPIEYEMLAESGSKHVCDATPAELKQVEIEVPSSFCTLRSTLRVFGVTPETPGSAFQLIVPVMFFIMGLRFLGIGIGTTMAVLKGPEALEELEHEEQQRLAAVHASMDSNKGPHDEALLGHAEHPEYDPGAQYDEHGVHGEADEYDEHAQHDRDHEELP